MIRENLPPEFLFLCSPVGELSAVLVALALLLVTLVWASRPTHPERWLAVSAASLTSLLVIVISFAAVRMGWWQGAFFNSLPIFILAAIYLPFSVTGYTAWLGIYRWLEGRMDHALWVYAMIVLLFVPIVVVADSIQMQRGQFSMGGGYTVWADVVVGQIVLWSPVIFYHWLRRKQSGFKRY